MRKIAPDDTLFRVAGRLGEFGFAGDGDCAIDALLENPYGIAVGTDGTRPD